MAGSQGSGPPVVSPVAAVVPRDQEEPPPDRNRKLDFASPATTRDEVHGIPEVVKLNVGGFHFTTSRSTLCRFPGSHLEAMFSGRHGASAAYRDEETGEFFVDRDGSHFRHVLNYLRSGGSVLTLPDTDAGKEELAIEADFFGLDGLVKAIRMPHVDVSEFVAAETLSQWEEESKLRQAFCSGDPGAATDPFAGLVPMFCPDHGIQPLPLKFVPDSDATSNEKYLFMKGIRKQDQDPRGQPVTVTTLEEFRTNFNREFPNILHRLGEVLLEEPVIFAGGSVLRALTAS